MRALESDILMQQAAADQLRAQLEERSLAAASLRAQYMELTSAHTAGHQLAVHQGQMRSLDSRVLSQSNSFAIATIPHGLTQKDSILPILSTSDATADSSLPSLLAEDFASLIQSFFV